MDFWERLSAHPEVILPLWGLPNQARAKDKFPEMKERFWGSVLSEHAPLASRVESRTAPPPNVQRALRLISVSEGASSIADAVGQDDFEPRLESYAKTPSGHIRDTREILPPGDLEGKMEEVTPQMTLRPIPRVEKVVEDELTFEHEEGLSTLQDTDIAQKSTAEALSPVDPGFSDISNLEIMLAHRKFHQRLLHRTQWSEHLGADIERKEEGPRWKQQSWVGWEPALDPIPHKDRAPGSGFLGDDDVPIPLD